MSWHSLKVVSEEEIQDKETNPELEKRILNLQHDIAILEAEIMQSKMKQELEMAILEAEIMQLKMERESRMAALKSQTLWLVQQLSNQRALSKKSEKQLSNQVMTTLCLCLYTCIIISRFFIMLSHRVIWSF